MASDQSKTTRCHICGEPEDQPGHSCCSRPHFPRAATTLWPWRHIPSGVEVLTLAANTVIEAGRRRLPNV